MKPSCRAVALFLFGSIFAMAQTASTGSVAGTVLDSTGGAIAGAAVEITNTETGVISKQTSSSEGAFVFPNLPPGPYVIKVVASGFRTASVGGLNVEVAKSYMQEIKMEVGSLTEVVEVTSTAKVELQTVDATIGTVINGKVLPTLPIFTRTVNELLAVQPGVTPAGEVTGSRADQSTLTLDGIDVTNNSVGGLGSYMYLGVEAVDEFRVSVANPNSSFGRGSGGQVSVISRRGGNNYHGGVFWYHQNDNLNANSWTNNRARPAVKKPELKDNRYGFTFGGPIPGMKNRTSFFLNHDGRRFPNATNVTRIVPLDSLKQGILRFRDASGVINSYNLRTDQLCGPGGSGACDPRGLGLNSAIAELWRTMPAPNDFSSGDGLNTAGFVSTVGIPLTFDFFNARLDHQISSAWRVDARIRYFRQRQAQGGVVDIRNGNTQTIRTDPTRQNFDTVGVSGLIKPNLTADFRFGRTRSRTALEPQRPNASAALLGIAAANTSAGPIALDVGGRGGAQSILSEPFDIDTQLARRQENDARVHQFNADLNWIKNRHTVQFGFHFRSLPTLHRRDDKVLGSLGALVAIFDSDLGSIVVPGSSQPPPCSASRTTGCLQAADAQQWNRLFAGVTGMMDNVTVLAVRDGDFKPLPFGNLLESDTSGIYAPEFYLQDVWRITNSLTFTYGLNYGWQTPPSEKLGRYTLQLNADTGEVITADFLNRRRTEAAAGNIYNPNFSFLPINNAKGAKVFNVDYGTLAPRVAVAWNPDGGGSFLGKMLGAKKTVFRAGYSLVYDRQNTVQSVIIPSLGIGFGQTLNLSAPRCNVSGPGGAGCNSASTNPVLNNYRIGVDGTIPVPTVPAQSIPVSPAWGQLVNGSPVLFPEFLSFQVDPNIKVGRNHAIDFTIQRELPGDMIVEASYIGRYASRLPQGMNLLHNPYNQLDKASGQTFAQAFDNVAIALRGGGTAAPQPFFENNVPAGGTATIVARARNSFVNGHVSQVFQQLDILRLQNNLKPFNNYVSQMAMLRSSTGRSNYNAATMSLKRRFSRVYYFDVSYTFSKSLDQLGRVQNSANVTPNSFDLDAEYGPSEFDIRHIFNGFGSYDLPFRSNNAFLKRVVEGWSITGIFTARSGDALVVSQSSPIWGGGLNLAINSGAIPLVSPGTFSNSVQQSVGSNNIGTNAGGTGSGLNMFANPEQVFNNFRRVEISRDTRSGRSMPLRGMPRWNLDASVGKSIAINEHVRFRLGFDFFNVLNKVDFNNPDLNLTNPRGFGVITSQFVPTNRSFGSRNIQVSARVDF
jgi:hypothetical protein